MKLSLTPFGLLIFVCSIGMVVSYPPTSKPNAPQCFCPAFKDLREYLLSDEHAPELAQAWNKFMKNVSVERQALITNIMNKGFQMIETATDTCAWVSCKCWGSIAQWIYELVLFQKHAIEMVDANFKIGSGILRGGVSFLGSYDQCLNIEYSARNFRPEDRGDPAGIIRGQYCGINLGLKQKDKEPGAPAKKESELMKTFSQVKLRFGICIPSRCSRKDVEIMLKPVFTMLPLEAEVVDCETSEKPPLDTPVVVAMVFVVIIVLFVFVSTAVSLLWDVEKEGNCQLLRRILHFFCVTHNASTILDVSPLRTKVGLRALHGIRFLSITWILLGHTYLMVAQPAIANLKDVLDSFEGTAFQVVLNAALAADTFFFISGFLVCYNVIQELDRTRGKMNWVKFYLYRLLRIMPPWAVLQIAAMFSPIAATGPFWKENIHPQMMPCRTQWWQNLLFISNLISQENNNICLAHGFFLSANMQFFLVSPLILYPLFKWPKLGHTINFLFLLVTSITAGAITSHFNLLPSFAVGDLAALKEKEFFDKVFVKPYCRMGPYCIGILVGYLLLRKGKANIRREALFAGWLLSIGGALGVVYGIKAWNVAPLPNAHVSGLYAAVHRSIWASAVGWMVYMCLTNRGGPINRFLSWSGFIPLSRISFMVFLIHPMVIWRYSGVVRERVYFTHYNMMYNFFGNLVMAFGLAFALSSAVEVPFLRMCRLLGPNKKNKAPVTNGSPRKSRSANNVYITDPSFNNSGNLKSSSADKLDGGAGTFRMVEQRHIPPLAASIDALNRVIDNHGDGASPESAPPAKPSRAIDGRGDEACPPPIGEHRVDVSEAGEEIIGDNNNGLRRRSKCQEEQGQGTEEEEPIYCSASTLGRGATVDLQEVEGEKEMPLYVNTVNVVIDNKVVPVRKDISDTTL